MKKLVRSLSTRVSKHTKTPTSPTSPRSWTPSEANTDSNTGSQIAPTLSEVQLTLFPALAARKASLKSPIPADTVLYFPECPHTTPPTPRPAYIPPVLRTEIVEVGDSPAVSPRTMTPTVSKGGDPAIPTELLESLVISKDDKANNSEGQDSGPAPQIRQYLATPPRCLDCTLSEARTHESWLLDMHLGALREMRLRLVEQASAVRAIYMHAAAHNGRPGRMDGKFTAANIADIEALEAQMKQTKEAMLAEVESARNAVRGVWDAVKMQWEGGVREVVRGDGTGEGEERCVVVLEEVEEEWDHDDDDDDDDDDDATSVYSQDGGDAEKKKADEEVKSDGKEKETEKAKNKRDDLGEMGWKVDVKIEWMPMED